MKPYRPEDLIRVSEISRMCQVDPRTVKRWISERLLQSVKIPGSSIARVSAAEFARFLRYQNQPVPNELVSLVATRFLIVDDEDINIKIVKRILKNEYANVDIQEARDGFQAGVLVSNTRPALIVLDLRMPGMDGYKVIQWVRSNPELKTTKILVVSSLTKAECQKAVDMGADAFLNKPVDAKELIAVVRRLLPKKS